MQTSSQSRILYLLFLILVIGGFFIFPAVNGYAQEIKDEKLEAPIQRVTEPVTPLEKEEEEKALKARWTSNIRASYGYESNPKLSTLRKGDHFETLRYTLDVRKTFYQRNQFGMTLDVNQQNYNEISSLTNTLGHSRIDYKIAVSKQYVLGIGSDLSFSNYPYNGDSTFFFPKMFVNFQHRLNKNFYHQLQYDFGWKLFDDARALLTSTSTYQDNKRIDVREAVEYSLGYTLSERLSTNFRISGAFNNSNSFFQDYYDYHSYLVSPRIFYKINEQFSVNTTYTYELKPYSSRLVDSSDYEQLDRLSNLKLGVQYKMNPRHSFTFDYTYLQNSSNNAASDYTGNAFEGGWRFIF